jgi:NAD(P)H-nitrite reductase large subunit
MSHGMKALLPNAALALLIVAAALAAYDRWVVRPGQVVGLVDVGEIYRQKEAEFTLLLTRAGSDGERDKAFAMARSFSQRLPLALEELPRDCGCLVVLKSAVAGTAARTLDLTAQLRRKVEAP